VKVGEQQIFIRVVLFLELFINFVSFIFYFIIFYFLQFIPLISGTVIFHWRILQTNRRKQFKIYEFKKHQIEVQESAHNSIIHIDGQAGWIFEWNNVSNFLVKNLTLIVDSFDTHKDLS